MVENIILTHKTLTEHTKTPLLSQEVVKTIL